MLLTYEPRVQKIYMFPDNCTFTNSPFYCVKVNLLQSCAATECVLSMSVYLSHSSNEHPADFSMISFFQAILHNVMQSSFYPAPFNSQELNQCFTFSSRTGSIFTNVHDPYFSPKIPWYGNHTSTILHWTASKTHHRVIRKNNYCKWRKTQLIPLLFRTNASMYSKNFGFKTVWEVDPMYRCP